MRSSNRIIVNTAMLYAKIIINMILSLWTVPLVLRALGQSDFGLYNLVAGVVAMLAFLNGSMTVVTQRFMSVTMGREDQEQLNFVYNVGIRIHLLLGIIVIALMEICSPYLLDGFLNIETGRAQAAIIIFQFMVITTFLTIVAVPFDAVLNAYENMLAFSVVAICESVLKLVLAFLLFNCTSDRLVVYGLGLALITFASIFARVLIVSKKYATLRISFRLKVPRQLYIEMLSFAGWNTFGSVAMIGKNQGIAIVLNLFKGTIINASYGIANQINGLLSSFTSSIQKAVSPQLMKKEGAKNHQAMIEMSFSLVKMATIIFSMMAIPALIEMKQVLELWLHGNVPPYTIKFCQLILIVQLLFQFSSGVALAIDATGKIKSYRIALSVVMLLNIPIAYMLLRLGYPPYSVVYAMIWIEFLCLLVRLYFARTNSNYPIGEYIRVCFVPLTLSIVCSFAVGLFLQYMMEPTLFRIAVVSVATFMATCIFSYMYILSEKELASISAFRRSMKNKVFNT